MIVTAATAGAVGILAGVMSSQGSPMQDKKHPKERSLIRATLDSADYLKRMAGKPLGIAGVSLSVGSLLKQSQLFTGILGSFFQVVGALIDSFLMPFMPFLFDQVAKLAGLAPKANEFGQLVYEKVEGIGGNIMDVWKMLANVPWGDVWSAFKLFFSDMVDNIGLLPKIMKEAFIGALVGVIPGVQQGRLLTKVFGMSNLTEIMSSLVTFFSGKTFLEIISSVVKGVILSQTPTVFKTEGLSQLNQIVTTEEWKWNNRKQIEILQAANKRLEELAILNEQKWEKFNDPDPQFLFDQKVKSDKAMADAIAETQYTNMFGEGMG